MAGQNTIPGVLAYHLEELDLSQKHLAEQLGVTDRTLRNINRGQRPVAKQTLKLVAAKLSELYAERTPAYHTPAVLTAGHFLASRCKAWQRIVPRW